MFNLYPYTDFHEINLDWIIRKIKELGQAFNDFEAVNKITNAGAWDITKQYQAWTIVSDNNIGYISLKPVPAGVAITNTEYWGLVADYDILITDLSARISALENTVGDNNSGLVHDVNALNAKSLAQLHGRRFVILTDSYGDVADSYTDVLPNYLPLTLNDNYFVFAYPSRGIKGGDGADGYTFLAAFQNDYTDVTDRDTITDFIILCGSNDHGVAEGVISSCGQDLLAFIKSNFVNANIFLGMLSYTTNVNKLSDFLTTKYNYSNLAGYGAKIIPGTESWLHYTGFMADTWHPNATGSRRIAVQLASWIVGRNGEGFCNKKISPTTSWQGLGLGFSLVTTPSVLNVWINNNRIGFEMSSISFTGTATTLPINTSWLDIAEFTNTFMQGGNPALNVIKPCRAVSNGQDKTILGMFRLYHNKLQVAFYPNDSVTSLTNVTSVSLNTIYLECDAIMG